MVTRPRARVAILAASALVAVACERGCGSAAPVAIPCETSGRPDVATLETRAAAFDAAAGRVVWRGVARSATKHALVDLALDLEARRADESVIQRTNVVVLGMRGKQPILVPDYLVPVEIALPVGERPHHLVASIARTEAFGAEADPPLDLEGFGAEKDRLRFQSLGHFHIPSNGDKSPFKLTLGVRNVGAEPIEAADLQVVFADDAGREADRFPERATFVPPLRRGDGVVLELSRPVRSFDSFRVEARGVTVAAANTAQ